MAVCNWGIGLNYVRGFYPDPLLPRCTSDTATSACMAGGWLRGTDHCKRGICVHLLHHPGEIYFPRDRLQPFFTEKSAELDSIPLECWRFVLFKKDSEIVSRKLERHNLLPRRTKRKRLKSLHNPLLSLRIRMGCQPISLELDRSRTCQVGYCT